MEMLPWTSLYSRARMYPLGKGSRDPPTSPTHTDRSAHSHVEPHRALCVHPPLCIEPHVTSTPVHTS